MQQKLIYNFSKAVSAVMAIATLLKNIHLLPLPSPPFQARMWGAQPS